MFCTFNAVLAQAEPLLVSTLPFVPGATAVNAPVPFPTTAPVNVVAPVPPPVTPRVEVSPAAFPDMFPVIPA